MGYSVGEPLESRRLLSNSLVFITLPTTSVAGSYIDSPTGVQVAIEDGSGNIVNSVDSISIALSNNPGGGTLNGTLATSAIAGVATFTNLSISASAIGYTLLVTDVTHSAVAPAASQPFNVNPPLAYNLHSIASLSSNLSPSGFEPLNSLYIDSSGNLFGAAPLGGPYDAGSVFEITEPGNVYTTLFSFTDTGGAYPGSRPFAVLTSDGKGNLFGTTEYGGASDDGTVFELVGPNHTFSSLVSFTGTSGAYPGATPIASLTSDGNGNLLGTTDSGGASGDGTLFELAGANHTFSSLVSFTGTGGAYPGANPDAILTSDGNGNLIGTTANGGADSDGTLFELTGSNYTFSSLLYFNGTTGQYPLTGLTPDGNGNLIGTTEFGGSTGDGTVFELAGTSHTFSSLFSFTGTIGQYPGNKLLAPLTSDGSGDLFGTTESGGFSTSGTLFELKGSLHTFSTLISFSGGTGTDAGDNPQVALTSDGNGNLFGTTISGGASQEGTVFELAGPSHIFSSLLSFTGSVGAYPGEDPLGLTSDGNGDLFGMTTLGGVYDHGTAFEIPASSRTTLTILENFPGGYGDNPLGALYIDSSGNLFGTSQGGAYGYGAVFEIAEPSGVYSTLVSFSGTTGPYPGLFPGVDLISDGNGNLFGTTAAGGTSNDGTIFELAGPNYTFSSLLSFTGTGAHPGSDPTGNLTSDGNGDLFGTTFQGGVFSDGTLFKLTGTSHTFSSLLSFSGNSGFFPGARPVGSLTFQSGGGGMLLGTTQSGPSNEATVFELAPSTLSFFSLFSFTGASGADPGAAPWAASTSDGNGNLFGTTTQGGTPGNGTVFELAGPSHAFSTLISFTGTNGAYLGAEPYGALTFDANGDLFGTTQSGGTLSQGTVFELTPSTQLSFPNTSSGVIAGAVLPSIEVNIKQSSGTLSTADSSIVTLSIQSGPNGAVLGGITSVTAVNGVATFTNLTLSLPGNYTLIATDAALSPATSPLTIQPIAVTWTGAAGGLNWSNPGNWSNNLVPTAATSATIGTGFTVQIPSGAYSVDSLTTSSPLEITTGATLQLFGPATFTSSLTIDAGGKLKVAADPVLLVVNGSAFTNNGTIDLGNNDMIIHNGNATQITPNIFSSSASTSTTLAIELNNDGHGNKLLTTFDNQTAAATDVLIKYTYYGDTNLNGSVDANDYIAIDNGFNQNLTGWNNGDFNYDGKINGDDYTLIDNAFNTQSATPLATVASPQLQINKAITKAPAFSVATFQPVLQQAFDPNHRRKLSLANEIFTD